MSGYRPIAWLPTASHPLDNDQPERLAEGTYIELVRSLFTTLLPTMIMAFSFTGIGLFLVIGTPDWLLPLLYALGFIAAVARIVVLLLSRDAAAHAALSAGRAGALERRFALSYLSFAIAFGAFSARAFALVPTDHQLLLVGLLFGYGAGVAAGLSLRPWISIPSALIAIVPTMMVMLTFSPVSYHIAAVLTAVFLAGGIENMLKRYQGTSRQLAMHRLISTLSRRDSLTDLPNRLLLGERFAKLGSGSPGADIVAIHRLDLDEFRSVNEVYGHGTGDALLKEVATCLSNLLEPGDFAVRLGGVELAVVQTGLSQSRDAELFARHVVAKVARTYAIDGHDIDVKVSIGYTFDTQSHAELDHMLSCANQALHRARSLAADVTCYKHSRWSAAMRDVA